MTWTPFALVSMYSAFINPEKISPQLSIVTSMLTKSSFFWTPIVYIMFDKRVQAYILMSLKTQNKTNTVEIIAQSKEIENNISAVYV